jgi:micrococcal nuclease
MRGTIGAIAAILLLLLASCRASEPPRGSAVEVRRVISGQTVEIAGTSGQSRLFERVRLIGIAAPDVRQQPWGLDAKQRLEQLVEGQSVILEEDIETRDAYDRRLAYLWQDDTLLNQRLVAEGHALCEARSPNLKYLERLARAQEFARLMGRGIWNPDNPMRQTPSEFRRQNR